jgi:hypothetical protein
VLGKRIDIRAIQVSINDVTSISRTVEPVSSAAFWSEEFVDPPSLRSVDLRFSLHGISFGGIKDLRCCRKYCARIAAQSEPERVNCMTNSVRFRLKKGSERSRSALRVVQAPNAFDQFRLIAHAELSVDRLEVIADRVLADVELCRDGGNALPRH